MDQKFTDTEAYADECVFFWTINRASISRPKFQAGLAHVKITLLDSWEGKEHIAVYFKEIGPVVLKILDF